MTKKNLFFILLIIVILIPIFLWVFFRSGSAIPRNSDVGATSTNNTSTPNPPRTYEYDVNLPNALMLVDAQGRRTGKDPATGIFYHEIPSTGYGESGHSGQLAFSALSDGQYALYVLGGTTGSYSVDGRPVQKISGTIQAHTMDEYTMNYISSPSQNLTLTFQRVVSSTASITTAPPNNLPPPAVP